MTFPLIIESCDARTEEGDFEHQFGTAKPHKFGIVGDLEVLPHVVCDGTSHAALEIRVIENPALRTRIEVEHIRLLLFVAATLPGKHCDLLQGRRGGSARFTETPLAIRQKGTGDLGYSEIEGREDKQFIPKYDPDTLSRSDHAAVRLIEADGLNCNGLQQVKYIYAEQHRNI